MARLRFAKALPTSPLPIRRIETLTEAQMRDLFLEAVGRLQSSSDGAAVLQAWLGLGWEAGVDALDWDGWAEVLHGAQDLLAGANYSARDAAIVELPGGHAVLASMPPEQALAYAAEQAGSLIGDLTVSTRSALMDIIAAAVESGSSIPVTANMLTNVIGLSPRYANALDAFERGLRAKGVGEGVIRDQVASYRDRLLRARAETIARYEVQDAMNQGRLQGWREAAVRGSIGPDATKQWVAGGNPCPACAELDGTEIEGLEGTWSGDLNMPPLHPNCRCSVVISAFGTVIDDATLN